MAGIGSKRIDHRLRLGSPQNRCDPHDRHCKPDPGCTMGLHWAVSGDSWSEWASCATLFEINQGMVRAFEECSAITGSGLGTQCELDILLGRGRVNHYPGATIEHIGFSKHLSCGLGTPRCFEYEGIQTSLDGGDLSEQSSGLDVEGYCSLNL